jgi:hypothetical protein
MGDVGRKKQALCKYGHVLAEGNLYERPDGQRQCLACKRAILRGRKSNAKAESRSPAVVEAPSGKERARQALEDLARKELRTVLRDESAYEVPYCSGCEGGLVQKQGKWGCPDVSCPMYGREQKGGKR